MLPVVPCLIETNDIIAWQVINAFSQELDPNCFFLISSSYLHVYISQLTENIGSHVNSLIWLVLAQVIAAIIVEDGKRRYVFHASIYISFVPTMASINNQNGVAYITDEVVQRAKAIVFRVHQGRMDLPGVYDLMEIR